MPRRRVRAPGHTRRRSLGGLANEWMEYFTVHGPGDVQGQPVVHVDEYAGLVYDAYALNDAGRRLYGSVFFSRPKGCDKSGLGSRFCLFEGLGPCRFAGWATGNEVYVDPWGLGFEYRYSAGEAMGQPVRSPFIRVMATEEQQTGNVYDSIYLNLTEGPLSEVPRVDAGLTRVFLPDGGEIRPSTASSSAKDGGKETHVALDETHLYNTPELKRMRDTVVRNLAKRKRAADPWYAELTTMFAPGQDSAAEDTYRLAEAILEGRARRQQLLFDHRWGEVDNLADEDALRAGLIEAYGDAMAWMDLDGLVDHVYDPRNDPDDSRRYYLNSVTGTKDAWIAPAPWAACADATKSLRDRDVVTLGFDGSINEDSTALVACHVAEGHLALLGCWEKPEGPEGEEWQVDREAVDAAVAAAFARYTVVGMYADPAHWQDYLDKWNNEFAHRLKVKATTAKPMEWWTNRERAMVAALERFEEAVRDARLSHDGGHQLTRHVLNARRRIRRSGITIAKEHPKSPKKIDAAMAATLAYECRADAVAAGVGQRRRATWGGTL